MTLITEIRSAIASAIRKKPADNATAVRAAEAALARLGQEREAAMRTIVNAKEERRSLLLADAPDAEVSAVEAKSDAAHRVLERLELLEPELADVLRSARGAQRQAELEELIAKARPAAIAYVAALREAQRRLKDSNDIVAQAVRLGLGGDLARVIEHAPFIINIADLSAVEAWEGLLDRRVDNVLNPPPRRTVPTVEHVAGAAVPVAGKPIRVASKPKKSPRPLPRAVPTDGEIVVTVLRSGIEIKGMSLMAGDLVALPVDVALQVARSGAVDLPSEENMPEAAVAAGPIDQDSQQEGSKSDA